MKSQRNIARQLFGLTLTLAGLMSWTTLPVQLPERTVQAATRARVTEPTGQAVSRVVANGRVAFVSSEGNEKSDIYTMEADGSNVRRLTNNPAYDQGPKWSPDGTKIAFASSRDDTSVGCTSGSGGCRNEIYVMNADGTNQTRTNRPGFDDDFDWAPDSTRIVFVSLHDGSIGSISVMNADGSNVRRLTNYPGYDFSPKWSPDGSKITFIRADDYWDGPWNSSVMNADGTNQTRLSDHPVWDSRWSPDGTKIVFWSGDSSAATHEIYVMNADGSNVQRLTNNQTRDSNPAWSPDGSKITFIRDCQSNSCPTQQPPRLWVVNADGSNATQLTDTPVWSHAWSPDGTKIIFGGPSSSAADLFVINADGSGLTNITNTTDGFEYSPSWQPLSLPPVVNPIDDPQSFIRQQYLDFLGREPDTSGFANWLATLSGCPNGGYGEFDNPHCDRVHVSAGFVQSHEFQGRGYWILRFGYVGLNRSIGSVRSSATFAEFTPALSQVGGSNSPAQEEAAKASYVNAFVQRADFLALFPMTMTAAQYVNALEANAQVTLSNKQALVDALNAGTLSRADVLRNVVESQSVFDKYISHAFVTMEYFGYLRRDPDTIGYQNWVHTLMADPSNYRHMIFGFIYSTEYRQRFGPA